MKNLKLTEIEKKLTNELLNMEELSGIKGGSCACCCGSAVGFVGVGIFGGSKKVQKPV